jgi:hypothetical protein
MPKVSVFVGQGDDGSGLNFMAKGGNLKSGFYIDSQDEINLMAEVINYKDVAQDVYVKVEYEYMPDMVPRQKDYYDVGMGAINVSPCDSTNLSKY